MARGVKATRVMRDGGWHVWSEEAGDFVPENAAPPAPPPRKPPEEISLRHERGVDPAGMYRLQVFVPTMAAGQSPEAREVVVEGWGLVTFLFNPNSYYVAVRFPDEAPVLPLLDVLSGSADVCWCRADEAKAKVLGAGGFVLLTETGYIAPYGSHAAGGLAAKAWSSWRRREEARILAEAEAAQAKAAPPVVESEEPAPTEAPRRRGSPWRRPTKEASQ